MSKFNDYDFFKYAFGPKEEPLTDEKFAKGLFLIAERLVANKYIEKAELENPLVYMKKCHETLKKWISDDYNTTNLNKYADFFTKSGEDFYKENDSNHRSTVISIRTITTTPDILMSNIAPDMMSYYYESGAFLRNEDNKEAHKFDSIFYNIDDLENCSDATKNMLKRRKERLSSSFPTKEQFKEAYKDFLLSKDSLGLTLKTFEDPMTDGRANPEYLTDKDKTNIAKNITPVDAKNIIKRAYIKNFNVLPLNEEEANAIDRPYMGGTPLQDRNHQYLQYKANLKERGDMLDTENVRNAINTILALKELHERRPWYQRFFYYFGEVGKELTLIETMKSNLVKRGVDAGNLHRALEGDHIAKALIFNPLPTKEERISLQKGDDKYRFFQALGIQGPDDPNLIVQPVQGNEPGEFVHKTFVRVPPDGYFEVADEDVKKYLVKEEMIDKDSIENDLEYKEIDELGELFFESELVVTSNDLQRAESSVNMAIDIYDDADDKLPEMEKDVVPFEVDIELDSEDEIKI